MSDEGRKLDEGQARRSAGTPRLSVPHPLSLIPHRPLETDLLGDLIRRKRSCLVQLRDMGEKQLTLVHEGNITRLLDLLAAKQHVLIQLQQVERQLDRFRGEDPEKRHWRTPQKRQECAADLAECERLLAQIVAQEKESEQELIRRRDETAARLAGVHTARQARGAYLDERRTGSGHQLNLVSDVSVGNALRGVP